MSIGVSQIDNPADVGSNLMGGVSSASVMLQSMNSFLGPPAGTNGAQGHFSNGENGSELQISSSLAVSQSGKNNHGHNSTADSSVNKMFMTTSMKSSMIPGSVIAAN